MIRRFFERRRYMREHRWTHAHLSDYLDGELSGGRRARAEDHLRICPDCHRVLATLRRTLEQLRGLHSPPAPGLADSVIARFRSEG